jgi:ADP-heptose:LPS heptosyltransferase
MNSVLKRPITHYNYRYLHHNEPLYYIQKHPKKSPSVPHTWQSEIYTAPLYRLKDQNSHNVLIGYASENLCEFVASQVEPAVDSKLLVCKTDLREFKYLSKLMRIPMIVVLNVYCNIESTNEEFELFYHYSKGNYTYATIFDGN